MKSEDGPAARANRGAAGPRTGAEEGERQPNEKGSAGPTATGDHFELRARVKMGPLNGPIEARRGRAQGREKEAGGV